MKTHSNGKPPNKVIKIYIRHVESMGSDLIFAAVTEEGVQLAGALAKNYSLGRFNLGVKSNKKHYLYEAYCKDKQCEYELIDELDDSKDPSKEMI